MSASSARWPALTGGVLRADLLAGLVLGLLLVPQALAYAQLAGLPPIHGLYCALLPVVVGALAGWCNQMQTGPVAMTAILVAATLAPLAEAGTAAYLGLAAVLAVLVGVVRIVLGLLRAADLTRLVSHPVLAGFTTAAAVIIAATQLPSLLGTPPAGGGSPLVAAFRSCCGLAQPHLPSIAMGGGCLVALLLAKRWPRLPGALIVIVLATLISWLSGYDGRTIGVLPSGLPSLALPGFDPAVALQLLPGAVLVALIGFAEVLSVTRSCTARTRQSVDLNRELIGQGAASLAAAVSGGFPPSGSLSRSALALSLGTRTALAAVISAAVVAAVLLGGTALLAPMPLATLAALVIVAVLSLIDLRALMRAWKAHVHDGLAGTVTLLLTLLLAPRMVDGLLAGIALAVGLFLWRLTRPRVADCARHHDGTWRDWQRMHLQPSEEIAVLRPDSRISFASAAAIEDAVLQAMRLRPRLRAVVLACEAVNELDATGCETLRSLNGTLRDAGIVCVLCGLKNPVMEVVRRSGLLAVIGEGNLFVSTDEAVKGLEARLQLGPQPWDPPTDP